MTKPSAQIITAILHNDHRSFQHIVNKVEQIKRFNVWFNNNIDAELRGHCLIGNRRDQTLIVITDSACVSTKIRMQTPQLLAQCKLHPELQQVTSILCKVRIANDNNRHSTQKKIKKTAVSPKTSQQIMASAKELKDEKLRAIMEKIAQRFLGSDKAE